MEQKKQYARIGIDVSKDKPPMFKVQLKNVTREMLTELITVTESIKFFLMEKYNKNMNFVQEDDKI